MLDLNTLALFDHQAKLSFQNLKGIQTQLLSLSAQQSEFISPLIEDLSQSLEELQVVTEELYQQNEELLASRQVLEREQKRYKDLFDLCLEGYLITNPSGLIQQVNAAAVQMLDVQNLFLMGKPLCLWFHSSEIPTFYQHLNQLRSGESIHHWQVFLQPRQKTRFFSDISASPIYDPTGRLIELFWHIQDLSTPDSP